MSDTDVQHKKPSASQKDKMKKNSAKLQRYLIIAVVIDLLFVAWRLWYRNGFDNFTTMQWIVFIGMQIAQFFCYRRLYAFAQPIRSSTVFLVNDLSEDLKGSMSAYFEDIMLIHWFVLVLAMFTDYAWWLLLIIPAYAGYKIYEKVAPFLKRGGGMNQLMQQYAAQMQAQQGAGGAPMDPSGMSKRQQKMQQRAEQQQVGGKRYVAKQQQGQGDAEHEPACRLGEVKGSDERNRQHYY